MPLTHAEGKPAIIDHIRATARHKLSPQEFAAAEHFIGGYYASIGAEDLLARSAEDLYGAVLAHWKLAQRRRPGTALLRVYNPHYENHGWQSTHTVVEIVTDDMPFLVDSLSMELLRRDYTIHLIIHPVMYMVRDAAGQLRGVLPNNGAQTDAVPEAVMRFEITRQTDEEALAKLQQALAGVLSDVRAVVEDWGAMRTRIGEIIAAIEAQSLPIAADEKEEALHFLRWVNNHHFTFIGFRTYDLLTENDQDVLRQVPGSGLGILRDGNGADASQGFAHIPAPLRAMARQPSLLIITKSTAVSTVHRPVHLDYLGIKRFNNAGQVIGEWRLLGLYSSLAYSSRPGDIPILRKKVEHVLSKSGFMPVSHGRKALAHILDTFPRDEMFQCTEQELFQVAMGILQVQERHQLGLFLRKDLFGRFVTALVYVPRERYHTELRRRIQDILVQALNGEGVEFNIQISDSPLARVQFIIRTRPERIPEYDVAQLQARMAESMLSWQDELRTALHDQFGEEQGARLFHRYGEAFSPAYRDDYSPRTAVLDIRHLEEIDETTPFSLNLYHPPEQGNELLLRFKVFGRDRPMTLTDVLPMLEQMGVRIASARPYEIEPRSGGPFWMLDFDMTAGHGISVEVLAVKDAFQETFAQVCSGTIENDGFNRLVLAAGLHWRSVVMLRALCKYLLQTRSPFSQAYMEQSLSGNAAISKLLVALFEARFDPAARAAAESRCGMLTAQIEKALENVANLDEDRILRLFLALIQAMLRTNYYQCNADGTPKPYLSIKLDPGQVPTLPQPRPMFEIFVYSPRVEGVHLRGGPVARGGIRWSDRREDFRTEILGLMKAQMIKNAVIVPVGAKGGFVAKRLPSGDDRDAIQDEVVFCYRTFISGLLDLTDNLVGGEVIAPPAVVRYDRDDPYLVVAADKGTATFSDIANRLADEYGFWLSDAFASGGSTGYDHKKIAITARGAWESVKRHFRELGMDIQRQDFTAVGIGDMAGDVFGNGMLLSPQLRLIAAFNHLHIFIDPAPDPATGYQERQRLFKLPRSAWSDYDPGLISPGGGVYSRRAKSIALSTEARAALGIDAARLTPNELIQAILRAPVDLLWNGGIGTFVKAGGENHADVGDRTNDALRIDATELRCKVAGEGGNLGFTQLARVEYAQRGGRINTDAIDNSGGVDCSDHEVNIKILLNQIVAGGDMTVKQRNQLLTDMSDEVAQLVLADNYLQTQSLSVTISQSAYLLSDHAQLIRMLEKEGRLKRKLEFLPNDEEIAKRETAQEGLTRPEIAVLLAYSKIRLSEELLSSDISEDPYLSHELTSYFPAPLREQFSTHMESHPLRREIIATQITNGMVNRMGSTFWMRMRNATGHSPAAIARAYTAAREIFGMRGIWQTIESLDNRITCNLQAEMLIETRRLLDRATLWLLRHAHAPLDIAATVDRYTRHCLPIAERLPRILKNSERSAFKQRERQFIKGGLPKELAARVAGLDSLATTLDLTEIAIRTDTDILRAAEIHFTLSSSLELYWLKEQIHALPRRDLWQRKARNGLLEDLHGALHTLTQEVLETTTHIKGVERRLDAWLLQNKAGVDHWRSLVSDIRASGKIELAMLSVAMREIRALAGNVHS